MYKGKWEEKVTLSVYYKVKKNAIRHKLEVHQQETGS
jgi:TfoX/Sxy family transcriptional regulator of competence genes